MKASEISYILKYGGIKVSSRGSIVAIVIVLSTIVMTACLIATRQVKTETRLVESIVEKKKLDLEALKKLEEFKAKLEEEMKPVKEEIDSTGSISYITESKFRYNVERAVTLNNGIYNNFGSYMNRQYTHRIWVKTRMSDEIQDRQGFLVGRFILYLDKGVYESFEVEGIDTIEK